jgi:hypothetical protein
MKLIKIKEKHYIIVDDSEIKGGDFVYDSKDKVIRFVKQYLPDEWIKKITHSTQFLEGVKQLVPSDIPIELIGEVDVFTVVEQWSKSKEKFVYQYWNKPSFIEGYNQALEDNKHKKYTEEDMKECIKSILRDLNAHNEIDKPVNFVWTDSFKKHIQSLQPKTEWEVEFNTNGKLKLK